MQIRLLDHADVRACLERWPLPGVESELALRVVSRGVAEHRLRGALIRDPATGQVLGYGVSGFSRSAFTERMLEGEAPLVASHLHAEAAGTQIYLRPDELSAAQRQGDLQLVVLAYQQHTFAVEDPRSHELLDAGHAAYRLLHEGYALRGVWQEGHESDAPWMHAGGYLSKRRYAPTAQGQRVLYGTLRHEIGPSWPSHTVSFLFREHTHRLHLSRMQRRVAELALWHLSDEQVAQRLSISTATVRRHWRGIFERLEDSHAHLMDAHASAEPGLRRGPEKRGRVLEFLRVNLHEVRP
ncbi:helix-turn-helix transcriptional regulator [Hydrogenophaga sp. IBVHS1]|jgi:DNA-binding CsgD family transcriptional regulator|uniref:helix-turn-helix transcriptional regulator n=1 Tax=unclassified Hydrogenophaga TaxID=2610897 RepID=UPI000A2E2357|nr:helix-turn-helix transcriptional regulator [Hydrogenophaga sp. IBVHS1]OSZ71514.1 hypothetical protein CAP37_20045 [Hydrogenophaga sp. IBVHS1]